MANKKSKPAAPQMSSKKWNYLLISLLVLLLAGAAVGSFFLITHDFSRSPEDEVKACNLALTKAALSGSLISEDEVLILDTAHKLENGDTKFTFRIFRLVEGTNAAPFMSMRASQAQKESQLEMVGSGSALCIRSNLAMISNLQVSHDI